jgi:spermidine synthase
VLVLGGGDGLAVRELLKHPAVESITLVDLDPEMTRIFSTHPTLVALNHGALSSPKVHVVNDDAFVWLDQHADMFDFVVVDFPDPNNYGVGKLYTTAFYRLLARHLSHDGLVVVQATSPLFARKSYWCIAETMHQAGLTTYPYHLYVPSFGEWGFVLASLDGGFTPPTTLPAHLRYLTVAEVPRMFQFAADMQPVAVEPNRLNTQVLVRYYEQEWERVNR